MNGLVTVAGPDEIQQRVSALTRDAFALLHQNAEDAYHAWRDGMLMVEGGWVAVKPTQVYVDRVEGIEPGVLISAESGLSLRESATANRMLQLSGHLLATFGAAIGCDASGWLILQRVIAVRETTSAILADEIVATRRLQRLLNEPSLGSDQ
ncbi:hypothetical protein [Robbsia sp. KACC 23696]|uniref:hypothetical protein n=1 Tax=Robbsia sp. KACC 23696 TaxID=3149231 RepID=UPI00325B8195